ncbi:C40 family peptidase [Lactobacillus mulieris]|uniref:C40 family peptidase n=1 Tax=Lactobacillus mulieris TaxID=2508708 RepID=UPI002244D5C3|nr:NlpC/P60 family protein [Lactobacillus mulieris]MCW8094048.1 NlpC/P60 family protein [Lactobacillus mulieris]MDK7325447.1 NlpC/P60 family protein [Lactobacillus mulieris]
MMYRIGSDKQWIPAEFVTIDKDADLPNYSRTTGILYVNYQGLGGVNLLDSQGNYQNQYVTNGSSWRYFAKATINGREMYKLGGDKQWIPAEFTAGFQNKSGYYQVQYNQIQPSIYAPGYNLGYNYEGVKTWLVMRRLGTYAGYANYNWATVNAVKNFQASHGLNPTGIVDLATWLKLGFIKETWYGIDSYVAPLGAGKNASREEHINAMINQAYKYLGKPYIVGASSSPDYGVDCSGLVLQALYAGGLNPTSISSTQHAHPGNEWNSRVLWADPKLMTVPLSDIQRGDLVFYYEPGTRTIWHVALYIGNGQVIESWPPRVGISTLRDYNRSIIAGVKRPFI